MYTVWRINGEDRLQIAVCDTVRDAARVIEKDKKRHEASSYEMIREG